MTANLGPASGQAPAERVSPGPSADSVQTDVTATSSLSADPDSAPRPPLSTLIESVLLVADQPVAAATLAQVLDASHADVDATLTSLAQAYDGRASGVDLRQVAGGWRLYTRAECSPWVERFVRDGQQARLTQAALETLAVVAYRQPVTRGRISAVRGVNVDGVVRSLVARGLLAEAGVDTDSAGTLYVTTPLLLEKLGLGSLEQLPSLAPLLPELSEFEQDSMST